MNRILIIVIVCVAAVTVHAEVKKPSITVFGIKAINADSNLALAIQEQIEASLLSKERVSVISRSNIELLLQEAKFQQSGTCLDEECAVQAGYLLGVEKMITGTVSKIGRSYNVVIKLLDVQSAKIEASAKYKHAGSVDSLLDIAAALIDSMFFIPEPPLPGPSVDTLYADQYSVNSASTVASDSAPKSPVHGAQIPETGSVVGQSEPTQSHHENPEQSSKSRTIGRGAVIILGVIAALVLSYQMIQ